MDFEVLDLGEMRYEAAFDIQKSVLEEVANSQRPSTLIFVEHPPVLTLGANFHEQNLLFTADQYQARGIELFRTDRGGDVTYHGPRQLVIYPIFRLSDRGKDLHRWLRDLEEAMISTVASFGLQGTRFPPHTGVWIGDRKVAAIGVKVRRWVSMHGIALNCNNDLAPFGWIVPCGIQGYGVTSLASELRRDVTVGEVKPVVLQAFRTVFAPEPADVRT